MKSRWIAKLTATLSQLGLVAPLDDEIALDREVDGDQHLEFEVVAGGRHLEQARNQQSGDAAQTGLAAGRAPR